VADAKGEQADRKRQGGFQPKPSQCGKDVAYSEREGLEGFAGNGNRGSQPGRDQTEKVGSASEGGLSGGASHWSIEPDVGRVAHGVPRRVDRLKGLGNAVVPQIPEIIGRAIMGLHNPQ